MRQDIRTFVDFLILARNRSAPGRNVEEYVEKLYQSLQWFEFGDRADFIFFYVVFDFHGLLPPHQQGTMVYPRWYKSYRASIALELGVSFQSKTWQGFTEFMKKLPTVLHSAQQIAYYNVTKSITSGTEESNERTHTEHHKLWAAMRYHYRHWSSLDSLRALLADIRPGECRYEVPLFSQYTNFETKPAPGNVHFHLFLTTDHTNFLYSEYCAV